MCPIFKVDSHSLPLMCHAMDLILTATTFVHPGQVPVIAFDQPLSAIAKKIQWYWPDAEKGMEKTSS